MKTLRIMFTRGDHATKPGGIVLRENDDGYVTHMFAREPNTREPTEYFWGHYFSGQDAGRRAEADFVSRCATYKKFEISESYLREFGDDYLQKEG